MKQCCRFPTPIGPRPGSPTPGSSCSGRCQGYNGRITWSSGDQGAAPWWRLLDDGMLESRDFAIIACRRVDLLRDDEARPVISYNVAEYCPGRMSLHILGLRKGD